MSDHRDERSEVRPDEDPIDAVSDAAAKGERIPIENVEPGVDPDSADSSRSLHRRGD